MKRLSHQWNLFSTLGSSKQIISEQINKNHVRFISAPVMFRIVFILPKTGRAYGGTKNSQNAFSVTGTPLNRSEHPRLCPMSTVFAIFSSALQHLALDRRGSELSHVLMKNEQNRIQIAALSNYLGLWAVLYRIAGQALRLRFVKAPVNLCRDVGLVYPEAKA